MSDTTGARRDDEQADAGGLDADRPADIPNDETSVADGDVAADGEELEGTTGGLA